MQVFISYSHDSDQHRANVCALADRLRKEGVDCEIDQYVLAPEIGWPAWMIRQVEEADFVLVVASAGYKQALARDTTSERGTGVAWEEGLISQAIYETKGRNLKFIPVLFSPQDKTYVPSYLATTTHYLVDEEHGYEALYRRVTDQPKVAKPLLGEIRILEDSSELPPDAGGDTRVECPAVVWRLPRGFLLLEGLIASNRGSRPVTVSYSEYGGTWQGATHFHPSYRRYWIVGAEQISIQCKKLGIPLADCDIARPALELVQSIGIGEATIDKDGTLGGEYPVGPFAGGQAEVIVSGNLTRQTVTGRLAVLGHFGPVRDLALQAEELGIRGWLKSDPGVPKDESEVRTAAFRLMREARLAMVQYFETDHPLQENVREVLGRLDREAEDSSIQRWALELASTFNEGIHFELELRGYR